MGYSIRTEGYRYTNWTKGGEGEELYDYKTDPRELQNLADDGGVARLKAKLRGEMERICLARGMATGFGKAFVP
jgi:Domain of unknown function (DUF4976)